jgi:RHH-type rel operon transcriptional repressor/antitoxin RelB
MEIAMTVSFTLDPETERRLLLLAERTGESTGDLIRNAVANGIEDLEEYFSAVETLRRIESGEEKTYPLEQVIAELGLDD